MRYADGPTARVEISVDAPPERVWELVSDIGLPARLSPELQETVWLDGATGPAVGARFEGRNTHERVGEWRTHARVEVFEAPKVFAWSVIAPDARFGGGAPSFDHPVATWRFELEPREGGRGTLLRQTARMGPARSGVSVFIDRAPDREEELVAARLAQLHTNIEATLRGVKALAEAPA
ncbi:SRPBCC family protein [Streptomyces sp. MUM 203J]|uniref:SRPBCC family protein n=1 Tax=Streptomyces sp. MUM 203J TaxID=2791990 RepID=UPI001F04B3CB|nr:SRPBCC family protein [Streptomyces sp. MUM 203J]MCH0541368.1 SRPBCC family protein [Streptomyces sp. MUM 203J]